MTYEEKLRLVRRIGLWASLAALAVLYDACPQKRCLSCAIVAANRISTIGYIRRCATMVVLAQ